MEFKWEADNNGNNFLMFGENVIAVVSEVESGFLAYSALQGNVFDIPNNLGSNDLDCAKKAVEAYVHDFCVTFNTWCMR
jgi:hypothetical protein